MKQWLKRIALTLLLLFLASSLSLYLLISQERGNQLLLSVTQKLLPELHIQASQGTLWRGLHIEALSFENDAFIVAINQARIQLRAADIFIAKLTLLELQIDQLSIEIKKQHSADETDEESFQLPQLITPFPIALKQLSIAKLSLSQEQELLFTAEQLNASATWFSQYLHLQRFNVQTEQFQAAADAQGSLRFQQHWPIKLTLNLQAELDDNIADYLQKNKLSLTLQASGDLHRLELKPHLTQPIQAQGELILRPLLDTPLYQAWLTWQDINIHINEGEQLLIQQGEAKAQGSFEQAHFSLANHIQWQQHAIQQTLSGQFEQNQLNKLQFSLSSAEQQLRLQGKLALDNLHWDVQGQGKNLNTATLIPELESQIHFDLQSQGYYHDNEDWQAKLILHTIHGQLQQQDFQAHVDIQQAKQQWSINSQFTSQENQLSWQGKFNPTDFSSVIQLHSKNLNRLHPQLAGKLNFDLQAQGEWSLPQLDGSLLLEQFAFQEWQLETAQLYLSHPKQQHIELHLNQLARQDFLLDDLHLAIQADKQEQVWQLTATGHDTTLDSHWISQKKAADYLLSFQQLEINHLQLGLWQLMEEHRSVLQADTQRISALCLVQDEQSGMFCLDFLHKNDEIQVNFDLQQLNLAPFALLLDENFDLNAKLNASLSANYQQQLQAQFKADIQHGYLQFFEDEQNIVRIPWQTIGLQVDLEGQNYQGLADLELNPDNFLTLNVSGQTDQQQLINGKLNFHINDLQVVELFSPLRQVQGLFEGQLTVTGQTNSPLLNGQIHLRQGSAQLADAGLELTDIELAMQASANGDVSLTGQILSDGRALTLNGQARQQASLPWPLDLHIQGSQVKLLNLKEAQLWASPDLYISLRGNALKNRGEIHVDKAHILLKELPKSALSPSSDTIIIGQEEDKLAWDTDTQLDIFLGQDFSVEGMGLKAKFAGDMHIHDQSQQTLDLTGVVKIIDGRYKAYGQNLHIERGNLFFQGEANNPGLDVVASRTLTRHQVKVGLEFGGTLKNPQSRVFSEPAMDETEAMSWLLFGKPLSSTSDNDASALIQAITVYGIEHGDSITHKLSDQFGLDIGFDTDGENDEAAFSLGKQLSSRLYLRYSVALFESLSSIMLRYNINKSLDLETRSSGQGNSIDLLYRREKD